MPKEVMALGDLQRSYAQTYVVYKNEVFWANVTVQGGREIPIIELYPISKEGIVSGVAEHTIDLNKKQWKDVKLDAPPLGWLQYNGSVFMYLQRNIRRQYKFGVHTHNVDYYTVGHPGREAGLAGRFTAHNDAFRAGMAHPKAVVYNARRASQVLTRRYAVIDNCLYHDIYCIGQRKDGVFRLEEDEDDSITVMDLKELGVPLA